MHTPVKAHLYTTKYKPATDTKPAMIAVYYDLMPKPVTTLCWQDRMEPFENHHYAVQCCLQDTNPRARIVLSGTFLGGYWFAVEQF